MKLIQALLLCAWTAAPAAQRSGDGKAPPAAAPIAAPAVLPQVQSPLALPALPETLPSGSVQIALPANAPSVPSLSPTAEQSPSAAQVPERGVWRPGLGEPPGRKPSAAQGRASPRAGLERRTEGPSAVAEGRARLNAERPRERYTGNDAGAVLPADGGVAARVEDVARAQGLLDEKRDGVEAPEAAASLAGLAPARAAEAGRASPEPPAPPEPEDPSKAPARAFLASILLSQAGGEIIYLAVLQVAQSLSGSFKADSLLGAVSFAALTAGSLVAGPAIDRFGIRKVYLAILSIELAAGVALTGLQAAGLMGFSSLLLLFGLDYLALGGRRVSESVMPTVLYSSSKNAVNSFTNLQEMAVEAMGIVGLTAVGVLLPLLGYTGALALYPLLMAAAAAVAFLRLRLPAAGRKEEGPSLRRRIGGVWAALKSNSLLRRAALGYGLTPFLYAFIYFTIIPNFARFAAHAGMTASRGLFQMSLLFAVGGLLSTLLMARLNARSERRLAALTGEARHAEDSRTLMRSASRWSAAAGVAFLGAWTLLLPATALGAWPAFVFMVPLALTMAGLFVNMDSVLKTEAPAEIKGSVVGVIRAAALLLASAGFPLMGLLFDAFSMDRGGARVPTAGAFAVLAFLLTAVGAVYLWLARSFKPKDGR